MTMTTTTLSSDAEVEVANPLVQFARWAISEGPWDGSNLDGGDVQRMALELGLITEAKYDPGIHGPSDCAEQGDPWFVFAPCLSGGANKDRR